MSIYSGAGYPCQYRAVILIQELFSNSSVVLLVLKSCLSWKIGCFHLADLSSALLLRYAYWSFIRCKLVSSTRVKQVTGSNCFAESCSCFQETSTSLPVPRARFRLHSFNAAGSVHDFREDLAQAHSICRRTWVVARLVNLAQHSGQCGRISAPDFKKKTGTNEAIAWVKWPEPTRNESIRIAGNDCRELAF